MTQIAAELSGRDPGSRTEHRVSWLTLLIGFVAAAVVAVLRSKAWAAGLAIGTALAWLNFYWLRRGMDGLVLASQRQSGAARPRVPLATYFAAAFRYGLLALAVYAIFEILKVPLLSMVVGLCALGAAAIVASVYEIWRPAE